MYAKAALAILNKEVDFLDDLIHITLHTSAYVPNQDVHDYVDDLTNEVVGTGYTAGGVALASKTLTTSLNVATADAADSSWATSTITARRAVVHDRTPATNATRPLIMWVDFGQDEVTTAGTFLLQWAAAGLFTLAATDAPGFP